MPISTAGLTTWQRHRRRREAAQAGALSVGPRRVGCGGYLRRHGDMQVAGLNLCGCRRQILSGTPYSGRRCIR